MFYLFFPTPLIYSLKHEHSCKILYLFLKVLVSISNNVNGLPKRECIIKHGGLTTVQLDRKLYIETTSGCFVFVFQNKSHFDVRLNRWIYQEKMFLLLTPNVY